MGTRPSQLVGRTLDGRYRVLREVGRGAMGAVYEAQHVAVGRRLALKVLDTDLAGASRERFFHEARAAGAITHQHIVPVLDFGFTEGGEPYIVMDLVEGDSLESVLMQQGPRPLDDAVEICSQVLSALEVIHGAGLVHRDIKPGNIMLARVRRPRIMVKLLDFGVARALHAAWRRPELTQVNEVLGTPAYFAPEQAAGLETDPRWDLWAVGVILYEMLSGQLPFRLENMAQVMADLVNHRLIPLRRRKPDLPEWVYQVQDRALHPSSEQRFQSATAFLQALESRRAYLPEEMEEATTPFVRLELNTPPPEIVGRLAKRTGRTARLGPRLDPAENPEMDVPTVVEEPPGGGESEEERSATVPVTRSSPEDLAAAASALIDGIAEESEPGELRPEDLEPEEPEPDEPERDEPEPEAAARLPGTELTHAPGRSAWIPVGIALLLLGAAAVAVYWAAFL